MTHPVRNCDRCRRPHTRKNLRVGIDFQDADDSDGESEIRRHRIVKGDSTFSSVHRASANGTHLGLAGVPRLWSTACSRDIRGRTSVQQDSDRCDRPSSCREGSSCARFERYRSLPLIWCGSPVGTPAAAVAAVASVSSTEGWQRDWGTARLAKNKLRISVVDVGDNYLGCLVGHVTR